MLKSQIRVGGHYMAKVNGRVVKVRVDRIEETFLGTRYHVMNTETKRRTIFKSAAKFRREVTQQMPKTVQEGEKGSDPTSIPSTAIPAKVPASTKMSLIEEDRIEPPTAEDMEDAGCPFAGLMDSTDATASPYSPTRMEGEESSDPTSPVGAAPGTSAPDTSEQSPEAPGSQQLEAANTSAAADVPLENVGFASSLCRSLAGITKPKTSSIPAQVAGYTPTDEQRSGLEAALELFLREAGPRVLVWVAGAGTGKTSSLKMVEQVIDGRGQYTAFNSKLVADSKPKFVRAKCNTTHSLAFGSCGYQFKDRIDSRQRMRSSHIAKFLGIEDFVVSIPGAGEPDEEGKPTDKTKWLKAEFLAGQCIVAVKRFCQSADLELDTKHFNYIQGIDPVEAGKRKSYDNNNRVKDYLLPFAQKAWEDLCDPKGTLPFNHDVYVKIWQLGPVLPGGSKPVIPADYILLDEYQDTAPVFVSILQQQTHAMLIMVGDDNQRIYEWRGAINAGDEFPEAERRLLSESFRFGQCIADVANSILGELEKPTDLVMKGSARIPSRVARVERPDCYLYRTNAGALGRFMSARKEGLKPFLVGKVDEIISFVKAALELQGGRGTSHPELGCFESWEEVQEYVKEDEGQDLRLMVKLVDDFGAQDILDALQKMPAEKDADVIISTAHKSKGLEWGSVYLGPDFKPACRMDDAERRLLYVAATRAKHTLDISECTPFLEYKDRQTGVVTPGIKIRYTIEMPTEEEQAAYLNKGKPAAESYRMPLESLQGQVGQSPAQSAANAVQANVGPANGIPAPRPGNGQELPSFTWKSLDGKWCIRGPRGHLNQRVTVTRRDGSSSVETLRKVVKEEGDVVFYATRF